MSFRYEAPNGEGPHWERETRRGWHQGYGGSGARSKSGYRDISRVYYYPGRVSEWNRVMKSRDKACG